MMPKHGPWTIKKRVRKYKWRYVELLEDQVIEPDGKLSKFPTVKINPGVRVLPMDGRGFVYLAKEYQYALGRSEAKPLSGGLRKNEKPLATAKRELREELGIEAKKWVSLGVSNPITVYLESPQYLFLATGLAFRKPHLGIDERIKMVKIKFEKAVEMVMKNKITESPCSELILKAKEYLKRK